MLQLLHRWSPCLPLAASIALMVASLCINDSNTARISLAPDFHVAVFRGHILFFNDGNYGPYEGSIVGIAGADYPKLRGAFGYWAGIYYRHFEWPNYELWTLAVCVAYLLLPGAVVSLAWWMSRWTAKPRSPRRKASRRQS